MPYVADWYGWQIALMDPTFANIQPRTYNLFQIN
jgi:hypothetical protein